MAYRWERGRVKWEKWLVGILGVADLILKHWAVSGEYAVINLGVSGGVVVSEWLVGMVLVGILYWYIREKSLGLWMILVGGGANVASRVVWGGVVDYWSLFGILNNNLADYLVVGGVIIYFSQCQTTKKYQ